MYVDCGRFLRHVLTLHTPSSYGEEDFFFVDLTRLIVALIFHLGEEEPIRDHGFKIALMQFR